MGHMTRVTADRHSADRRLNRAFDARVKELNEITIGQPTIQ
jgi:hypothetical protein